MPVELKSRTPFAIDFNNPPPTLPKNSVWCNPSDGNSDVLDLDSPRSLLHEILLPYFHSCGLRPPESLLSQLECWSKSVHKDEIDEACGRLARRMLEIFKLKRNVPLTAYAIKVVTGQPDIANVNQIEMAKKLGLTKQRVGAQVKKISEELGVRSRYMRSKYTPKEK